MSAAELALARKPRAPPPPPPPAAANPAAALGLGLRKGRRAVSADADVLLLFRAKLEPRWVCARRRRPDGCAACV